MRLCLPLTRTTRNTPLPAIALPAAAGVHLYHAGRMRLARRGSTAKAATDVIAAAQARGTAEPWTDSSFMDVITSLQRDRQLRAAYQPDEVQFHDRCALCTAALAVYLGRPLSTFLAGELERLQREAIYQRRVLLRSQSWLRETNGSAADQLSGNRAV
jgi:predicted ATPase